MTSLAVSPNLNLELRHIPIVNCACFFQIDLTTYHQDSKEMFLLNSELMLKEEKDLRKLLPISAFLHNCLVLALNKARCRHLPIHLSQYQTARSYYDD